MLSTPKKLPHIKNMVGVRSLTLAALAVAAALVFSDLVSIPAPWHALLSSLPLALAGFSYALLQFRLNPPGRTLLKRLLLAATFVVWAMDQLLPAGPLATFIGDLVIAAYVLDLFWLIQEQVAVGPSSDSDARVR